MNGNMIYVGEEQVMYDRREKWEPKMQKTRLNLK